MSFTAYILNQSNAFTHDGIFHADDVFTAALLRMVNPDIKISRGDEVSENFDGIIFDIGGGDFDHHQTEKKVRPNGIAYASFGLMWEALGPELVGITQAEKFDQSFVQLIDESDNTGKANILSGVISDMNPLYKNEQGAEDAFEEAVEFAGKILFRKIRAIRYAQECYEKVRNLAADCADHILFLPEMMPWKEAIKGFDITFVIYESLRGGYNVQAVPQDADMGQLKKAFPQEWRGMAGEVLEKAVGIKGLRFCHNAGFLCATDSLETAYQVARCLL